MCITFIKKTANLSVANIETKNKKKKKEKKIMQKVSKQSLAMIALSILLAISIALTVTFAAMQDSKTATGTITFTGGASVAWNLNDANTAYANVSGGNLTITLDNDDFDFADNSGITKATLKSAVWTELQKITLTIKNTSSTSLNYKVSLTSDGEGITENFTTTEIKGTLTNATGDDTNGVVNKNFIDIFTSEFVVDNADEFTTGTFEVTAEIGASVVLN